jgi:hypothetical protein
LFTFASPAIDNAENFLKAEPSPPAHPFSIALRCLNQTNPPHYSCSAFRSVNTSILDALLSVPSQTSSPEPHTTDTGPASLKLYFDSDPEIEFLSFLTRKTKRNTVQPPAAHYFVACSHTK